MPTDLKMAPLSALEVVSKSGPTAGDLAGAERAAGRRVGALGFVVLDSILLGDLGVVPVEVHPGSVWYCNVSESRMKFENLPGGIIIQNWCRQV